MREVPAERKEREERTGIPLHLWVTQIFNTLFRERTGIIYLMHFYARTDFPFTQRFFCLSTFFDSCKDQPAFLFHSSFFALSECGEFLVRVDD